VCSPFFLEFSPFFLFFSTLGQDPIMWDFFLQEAVPLETHWSKCQMLLLQNFFHFSFDLCAVLFKQLYYWVDERLKMTNLIFANFRLNTDWCVFKNTEVVCLKTQSDGSSKRQKRTAMSHFCSPSIRFSLKWENKWKRSIRSFKWENKWKVKQSFSFFLLCLFSQRK